MILQTNRLHVHVDSYTFNHKSLNISIEKLWGNGVVLVSRRLEDKK